MTDKWIMEDWMREVWESCGLEPLSKQCGVESDYSISTVSYKSRIIPILKQLRTAGRLLTEEETVTKWKVMNDELTRLRAENERLRNGLRNILGVIEATKVALGGDHDVG